MAKVFTGKVLISGDEIKDYLQLMKQAEKEKEPFREMLDRLNQEFEAYLTEQFSVKTARKHSCKTALFIDFLCWNTDVKSIDEITKGIANSYFRKWYMSKIGDCSESELKSAIKKFFQFLAEKKGIRNEKVLMSFGIR
jgi:site-specific recombinase XerD